MNLLVVDKTAVLRSSQQKFAALSAFPDIELSVLCPKLWRENYMDIPLQINAKVRYRVYSGSVFFRGRENRAFYVSNLVRAIRGSRADIILMMEEPFSLFAFQTVVMSRLMSPNSKLIFYTWDNISTRTFYPYRPSLVYRMVNDFVFSQVYYAFVANPEAQNILRSKGFDKPIKLVPYGMDVPAFEGDDNAQVRNKLGLGGFVVGYVGRLLACKGLATLVEALSQMDNASHLLVVGDGPYREELLRSVHNTDLGKRFTCTGMLPPEEIPLVMKACDVIVLPSRTTHHWKEQFGRVLVEGMASGIPVVGSDSGAIPWVISDAGLIFKEGDARDLATKLSLLRDDVMLRQQLAARGRQRAREEFSWEQFARKVYETCIELVGGSSFT